MLSNSQTILLGMLLSGFFAVACLRASTPVAADGKFAFSNLFRFPGRIERLRRTRWQWFSMVLLMLVLRLQHILPISLEAMAALQFVVFLAAPVRTGTTKGTRGRGDGAVVANH